MIKLIVLDVDGTLTNGQITYTNSGDELKSFDVADGLAIATWTKKLDKKAAIITGRTSKIVEQRAKDLKITHLYQGVHNKDEILENILKEENISWHEVAVIGDDLNDYKMLKKAGLSFTPANGSKYIKDIVNIKCEAFGGSGAVREMIEYIVKEDGIEEEFINSWL
ncbi:KdsC family phosphatase [Halarcobacter bivalviorum]|uniref:3-deoxy-D-manno-octulosonate 8-phosphate phosphatase n=1 Tax=Halarcobacter bivalviorum TaxID=663364 RepID=A0AAX2AAW5_9BACT|nr:HAD family hydrolase [Halarcobacter bivalviorum]AXH12503.1 3-deoxy-D-manno-octulosonate 8-phosphate phosphatase, YrbI family [Halarcobacter bivalviorum]RXK07950.1 3-deoxy-D-manno-octulosonate 8-phosphate phosphatase [Halarcobacter bivalviorum]RXK10574.1 3-deoxy-D-manno-octulosonate 8-phosphate phosphatase [Halarcobacter bivalviorum]